MDVTENTTPDVTELQETENKRAQILAVLIACLPALNTGLGLSWPSPSVPAIINDKITYNITLEEASYVTVIPPITTILSSFIFSPLIDLIGRKYTLLLVAIPQFAAWILVGVANSVYVFYASRLLTGISDACVYAALTVYIGEVCTPEVRGTWGNMLTFNIYLGEWAINWAAYAKVSTTGYICSCIPVIFAFTFIFLPESPYYLLMKGRSEDAKISLQKLRGIKDVDQELSRLSKDVERQLSESGTWKDLFLIPSNRKALYCGVFLRSAQQLSGGTVFVIYTQYIFDKAGGNLDATSSSLIFMGLLAGVNACAAYTLDKIGKKRSVFWSCLLCGVILIPETVYFYLDQNVKSVNLESWSWVPLAGMIIFVFTFGFGLGIAPTLMAGELFSTSVKGKGLCILNIVFGLFIASVTKVFQVMQTSVGLYLPFACFAIGSILCALLVHRVVPETRGKTLEEIQQDFKKSKKVNCDLNNSSKW